MKRRSVRPAVLGVRGIVKGKDGVNVSVREQERLERNVFVCFTAVDEGQVPETRNRTGLGMPVVERVGVHSDVVLRFSDGLQHALDGIRDDRARIRVVQLQKGLIE